jgi:hypothetical protein
MVTGPSSMRSSGFSPASTAVRKTKGLNDEPG